MRKLTHVEFCDIFNGECDEITCEHCERVFNAIREAEGKFISEEHKP